MENKNTNNNQTAQAVIAFKEKVSTAEGTKEFFSACTDVKYFNDEALGIGFDICNDDDRFIYYLNNPRYINYIQGRTITSEKFEHYEYFKQFLVMLSDVVNSLL